MDNRILLEINENDNHFNYYTSSIDSAISQAELDIKTIDETIESIKLLKPNCDSTD